jgi:hypothetical protein
MNHFSIQVDRIASLSEQLAQVPFQPSLGIVFASVSMDISAVADLFRDVSYPVVGASSCGEFIRDSRLEASNPYQEVISSEGLVMVLLQLPEDSVKTYQISRDSVESDLHLGQSIGDWALSAFADPQLIVLASGLSLNGDDFVRGMMQHKPDMPVFGGLAGDDSQFEQTWVFSNGGAINSGVVAVAFDSNLIEVVGNAVSGWKGIGAMKTVTHSEGNRVYTIDRQPALDTYIHYLNIAEDELPQIGVDYPILLKQGNESILRAVLMVDSQSRSLVFAGNVPQGSQIQFASCPGNEVLDASKLALDELHQQHTQADVVIAFSCMARHLALGPDIQAEIDHAFELWQAPVIGFFTYGEIGSTASRQTCLFNETLSLMLLREK